MNNNIFLNDDNNEYAGSNLEESCVLQYSAVRLDGKGTEDYLIVEKYDKEKTLKRSEDIMKTYMQELCSLKVNTEKMQ